MKALPADVPQGFFYDIRYFTAVNRGTKHGGGKVRVCLCCPCQCQTCMDWMLIHVQRVVVLHTKFSGQSREKPFSSH